MADALRRISKSRLYDEFARITKALASGRRLELVDLLAQGERTVEGLAVQMGLPIANVSQHLQVLRQARLVETRKEGTYVYYRLGDDRVFQIWKGLRELAEARLAEIDKLAEDYFQHPDVLEPVQMSDLLARLEGGEVVVIDVRPEEEYQAGHIAGSRSIPLQELKNRLRDIPADLEVVAYCRGPYCVFAHVAVQTLRAAGYTARRMQEGFPEWQHAGFPVE